MPVDFNQLKTALILLDLDCCIVELNEAAQQFIGISGRQLLGQSLFHLVQPELEQSKFNQSLLRQFAESEQTGFIEDLALRTGNGLTYANVMLSGVSQPTPNQPGASRILLEIQCNEHHSHIRKDIELQQQTRVSNHLLRNLAHEIKNPLGGIKGAAQLLERKLPEDFSHKYCQIIIQETDRLNALVSRLLLPAVPEAAQRCNIHLLIEKAIELVSLQFEHKFRLVKDYDPSLPDLLAPPGQIQQCLLNLIKNAAEAIDDKGQITLRTRINHQHTIGTVQHKQVLRVDVIDNGQGIPESLIKDIFYPTISSKNSSGLGLSIAQSLAQHHGGIIEVDSQVNHTCFSLYLPLVSEQEGKDSK